MYNGQYLASDELPSFPNTSSDDSGHNLCKIYYKGKLLGSDELQSLPSGTSSDELIIKPMVKVEMSGNFFFTKKQINNQYLIKFCFLKRISLMFVTFCD